MSNMITHSKQRESILLSQVIQDHLWQERLLPHWRLAKHPKHGGVWVRVPDRHIDLWGKILKAIGLQWCSEGEDIDASWVLEFCSNGPYGCWVVEKQNRVRCYDLGLIAESPGDKKILWSFLKKVFL